MTAAVRIDGVSKAFIGKGGAKTQAVRDFTLQVETGEFVSLIGPSGCGKSTLLRMVGDLIPPSSGEIRVNSKSAAQARADREYGIVFQQATLYDWRTVAKNVQLPLEIAGMGAAARETRTSELLRLVQLEDFAGHYPRQLSGGMQQRVAIARALSLGPSLLLMDEPFGALDEMTRERMQTELLRIWGETGPTVVFVTHSIPEAVFLSNRTVVMSPRPGTIAGVIEIDLPQPRNFATREDPHFFELITEVREALRGSDSGLVA